MSSFQVASYMFQVSCIDFQVLVFLDEEEITLELTPDDVETWDSLNHLRLVTAVENEFGIKLSMRDIESISSLETLNRLVGEGS